MENLCIVSVASLDFHPPSPQFVEVSYAAGAGSNGPARGVTWRFQ